MAHAARYSRRDRTRRAPAHISSWRSNKARTYSKKSLFHRSQERGFRLEEGEKILDGTTQVGRRACVSQQPVRALVSMQEADESRVFTEVGHDPQLCHAHSGLVAKPISSTTTGWQRVASELRSSEPLQTHEHLALPPRTPLSLLQWASSSYRTERSQLTGAACLA